MRRSPLRLWSLSQTRASSAVIVLPDASTQTRMRNGTIQMSVSRRRPDTPSSDWNQKTLPDPMDSRVDWAAMKDQDTDQKPKRHRGRPTARVMPDPIPDTPENVVRALCQGPPKPAGQWEFEKPGGAGYASARRAPISEP